MDNYFNYLNLFLNFLHKYYIFYFILNESFIKEVI